MLLKLTNQYCQFDKQINNIVDWQTDIVNLTNVYCRFEEQIFHLPNQSYQIDKNKILLIKKKIVDLGNRYTINWIIQEYSRFDKQILSKTNSGFSFGQIQ